MFSNCFKPMTWWMEVSNITALQLRKIGNNVISPSEGKNLVVPRDGFWLAAPRLQNLNLAGSILWVMIKRQMLGDSCGMKWTCGSQMLGQSPQSFFWKVCRIHGRKTMKPGHMNLHAFVDRWCLSPFVVVMRWCCDNVMYYLMDFSTTSMGV